MAAALAAASLAFVIPLTAAPITHADDPPPGVGDLEKSIVFVETTYTGYVLFPAKAGGYKWSDKIVGYSGCTGFFVSKTGDIATAGHCVDPAVSGREKVINKFLKGQGRDDLRTEAMQNWKVEGEQTGAPIARTVKIVQPSSVKDHVIGEWTTAQVVDFQPFAEGDNALLKYSTSEETPPLVVSDSDPAIGDQLTAIGFPGIIRDFEDPGPASSVNRPSFKTGTVSSHQISEDGVPRTEVSIDIQGGMSGGPTVGADNEVMGVNSFGYAKGGADVPGLNYITDATDLRAFLSSHDVPLAQPEAPAKSVPWALFASIAVAVLVLIGVVLFLLVFRKKPATPQGPSFPAGVPPQYPPPSGPPPQQWYGSGSIPPQQAGPEPQKRSRPSEGDPPMNPFSV
ncbi:serine protease [Nocardia fluminea]|uniref:S1 family peptidase n=1 Tax=Nocardia fluminea TaxID=134984 RepID=UPI00366A517E